MHEEVKYPAWSHLSLSASSFITESSFNRERDPYNNLAAEATVQVCLECAYGPMYYLACQQSN